MIESLPLHAVLYQDADGALRLGDRCTTRGCAIDTVKPLDGTIVRGVAELDQKPGTALAFWKRHQAAGSAAQGAVRDESLLDDLKEAITSGSGYSVTYMRELAQRALTALESVK